MTQRISIFFTGAALGCISTLALVAHAGPAQVFKQEIKQPQQPAGRIMHARVTAYCPCEKCCGKYADGLTSRGSDAWRTRGVAVDPKVIPYGSQVTIPGYGTFVADDTGSAMKKGGVRIDLRFPTHAAALEFGVKEMDINVR